MKKIRSVPFVFANIRFANDILASRIELKLTLKEVGDLVGLNQTAISAYENGDEDNMKMQNFLKMCNIFDLNPNDYLELGE